MFVFLMYLIYIMEFKYLNLRFLIYFAKITNFLYILRMSILPIQYKTIQRFCKTARTEF